MTDDPADAIGVNYIAAFELIARHSGLAPAPSRRFGDVLAVATGLPSPSAVSPQAA